MSESLSKKMLRIPRVQIVLQGVIVFHLSDISKMCRADSLEVSALACSAPVPSVDPSLISNLWSFALLSLLYAFLSYLYCPVNNVGIKRPRQCNKKKKCSEMFWQMMWESILFLTCLLLTFIRLV